MIESSTTNTFEITRSGVYAPLTRELDSFDKVSSLCVLKAITGFFLEKGRFLFCLLNQ